MGLEPIWISPFDFKSNAYTNSATRALFHSARRVPKGRMGFMEAPFCRKAIKAAEHNKESLLSFVVEAPTGIEPVYKVLQTSA